MPISVTLKSLQRYETMDGTQLRRVRLAITGLTVNSNNVVAHGLAGTPFEVNLEPDSNNNFWQYQDPDATNIYIGVGAAAGTTCKAYVDY